MTEKYTIIITPDAQNDMIELSNYIEYVLMSKRTALSYIRAIRKEISKLKDMPKIYKTLDEEPWHSRQIRKITAKKFFVYYRVDDSEHIVYILNVIYAQRDQLQALLQKKV